MAAKDTDREQRAVSLDRADVVCADDGTFLLPVRLSNGDQQTREHMVIRPDEAARLHAQLDRLLSRGWAQSEQSKVARQHGETYPVSGSGRLK